VRRRTSDFLSDYARSDEHAARLNEWLGLDANANAAPPPNGDAKRSAAAHNRRLRLYTGF
jgi:hypothetical protein